MRRVQSRTRSHVVQEAKDSIDKLYSFEGYDKEVVKTKIEYLLYQDRFQCHEKQLEVRTSKQTSFA
jgi:hypothetical protein